VRGNEDGVVKGVSRDVRGIERVEEVVEEEMYVPKYTSSEKDVLWAKNGLVATVLNGEEIPVIQRKIFDAGFEKLDIIPLGADKVLLRMEDDGDVRSVFNGASEFFEIFFVNPIKWKKELVFRERGAWVRIYGIPLHAWNIDFFKLCVFDCGRLLKVDDFTLDKTRFDYARVLISTSSLDILRAEAKVLVDGELLEFTIIEEWGFALGEDACLGNDVESEVDNADHLDVAHEDAAVSGEVEVLLNHLSEEWQKEEDIAAAGFVPVQHSNDRLEVTQAEKNSISVQDQSPTDAEQHSGSVQSGENVPVQSIDARDIKQTEFQRRGSRSGQLQRAKSPIKRTNSCPPGRAHSSNAGPWSFEWVNRFKNTANVDVRKFKAQTQHPTTSAAPHFRKKKGNGYIQHCARNLKRIARLSEKDRKEVLRALRKTHIRRKRSSDVSKNNTKCAENSSHSGSQASVTNDWAPWLVLHGSDKVKSDDVRGIGTTLGLQYKGDKNNRFDVLSGVGRKNPKGGGEE
jgi:hypothetical protein